MGYSVNAKLVCQAFQNVNNYFIPTMQKLYCQLELILCQTATAQASEALGLQNGIGN